MKCEYCAQKMDLIDVDERGIVWYGCRPCQRVFWVSLLEKVDWAREGRSTQVDFDGYINSKYSRN